ncbi:transporter [Halobacillus andaensis]|uniref:Transporter n=1 Tax=Halobacillus andaensis TaxID=1176239 RepID=A0A917AZT0_HALAA|nr:efflux RND transporter permease subunit [Halobacillus andaensis]MBP2003308.1 multidrug efflux pump subunit AcrB [Halobacillus andaensis]GGF09681.1 transporter [Halobacillus andaensis]
MRKLINYKKMVWVLVIILIFTGIFTYFQLPKREIPEISVDVATISTAYPGASPEEVERAVINPLEEELLDVDGIEEITSNSTTGFGTITATLDGSTDSDTVNSQIQQVASDVSSTFPEQAESPDVSQAQASSAVAAYHLLADSPEDLYELRGTIDEWEEKLSSLNGVDSIEFKGLPEQRVTFSINNEALEEYQVTPNQVLGAIEQELSPAAIGTEEENNTIYQLTFEKYNELSQYENLAVSTDENGDPVTFGDIGEISIENESVEDLISVEEQSALTMTVLAEKGVNISALQEDITGEVESLSNDLPSSVTVEQFYTQSTVIDEVYTNLVTSFAISLFAVIFIMILGLPLSSAILVAVAIPISILIGLIPLPYIGVDLNQISVIGIIIAIGILVDDAIVVNDNIQRRFQLGDSPLEGTINGIREVRKSIITSTLMIVFSFFPLTFISGTNGEFIRALPSVLIFTVLASTFIALTLIPTVQYARRARAKKEGPAKVGLLGKFFNRLEKSYADRLLPKVTKKPIRTGVAGILVCLLLSLLVFKIPFEFFPAADRPEVTISVKFPQGTTLEESEAQLNEMEDMIVENEETVTETAIYAGSGLPNLFNETLTQTGENTGQLLVRVDRDVTSATTFISDWEEQLRNEFTNAEIFLDTIVSGPPPSPPVELKLQGPNIDTLAEEAENVKERLESLEYSEIVTLNIGTLQPIKEYSPDRELLAENNISVDTVTSQLQIANTGIPLGTFDDGNERLPVQLLVDDGNENGVNLSELTIVSEPVNDSPPNEFTLEEIINESESEQIGVIPHLDGDRTITIEAYPLTGEESVFTSSAQDEIEAISNDLPEGYTIKETGQSDAQSDFFVEVSKLFVIVLFLIYVTIALQFNSLTMPLLITSSVFIAITGAIIGLFVTNEPLSFLAVLGIVSLSGIVVRNSVILIEFIEQNKNQYTSTATSVIEAGRARIRPIVLTSLTSIAALTPIIFTGDVLFKPLAISIVSGLLFSTVLTLILIPAFYLILDRIRKRAHKI